MKIRWLSTAENDLVALINYIAEDNPHIAINIFNTIRISVEKLKMFPFLGREGRVENTRELIIPYYPYIIVYRITKDILILAVFHTSRKWPNEFKD